MPIVVHYVSTAFVVVIKLRVTPVSVPCLAARMQVISLGMNVLAGLEIRA
jgi:hypothetical protein